MSASAVLQTERLAVTPGEVVTLELTVRNTGSIVDEFACQVIGEAAPWSTVEPPSLSLLPNSQGTVAISISPPRTAAVLAGPRTLSIAVQPREQVEGELVEEAELEVLPFTDVSGELVPQTARARRWGDTRIALDNRGNHAVEVLLIPGDPDELVRFKLAETTATVPPGEAIFVPLRVRAKRRPLTGRALVLPLTVTVEPSDGPVVELVGAVQQVARIPPWLVRALILAGLGLIALLVFWFALAKPTLESTAREAVEEQVLSAQDAAQDAGAAAGSAGQAAGAASEAAGAADEAAGSAAEAAGSAAEAAAEPTEEPTDAEGATGAASQLRPGFAGDPVDFRLAAAAAPGSSSVDTFGVPEDQTLALTDIVLQNPQGDTGTLQVRRDGGVLLEVRLENFRDLDYHFVAPIIFAEEQQVGFALTCAREDEVVCSAGAYFAGYISQNPPEEDGG